MYIILISVSSTCGTFLLLILSFVVAPVVTTMNHTVTSPNTTVLNCIATAKPLAEIRWIRNGIVLTDNTTKITTFNTIQGDCNITSPPSECVLTSILEITDTLPQDGGEYMCVASNPAGSTMETVLLTVNGMCMT